jgi:hypothetical protein
LIIQAGFLFKRKLFLKRPFSVGDFVSPSYFNTKNSIATRGYPAADVKRCNKKVKSFNKIDFIPSPKLT